MSKNVFSAENQQERLPKLLPDYIVGLVDGEGYFSVSATIDRSKNYLSRRVRLVFGVKIKEEDGGILYRLKETFGCGEVSRKIDTRPKFSNCLEYQVRDYTDIKTIIIPFFQKYRLQIRSKRASFEGFCKIGDFFEKKIHLTEEGFEKVKNLAKAIH